MGLTQAQATIWQKARTLGSGGQAVDLTDGMCIYLLSVIVHDLELSSRFPEFKQIPPPFFGDRKFAELSLDGPDPKVTFERLVASNHDADTYFACLAALHKARLKYERILSMQPIPTLEQVGPRGLLQYGQLTGKALAGFLFWRKWFFDIDNRSGQETGYLFEPIIAHAIGGTPAPASKSPVKRFRDRKKGRQVDCLLDKRAYEVKIRVTIASSGQGRWQEELDFPSDCRKSGFTPVLICMDGTPNPKLADLIKAFKKQQGEVYVGDDAWRHLDSEAGPTMARFLEKYVKSPIQDLLQQGADELPELVARFNHSFIDIIVGGETLRIERTPEETVEIEPDEMPEDLDDDC
jgi:hypothetical protein